MIYLLYWMLFLAGLFLATALLLLWAGGHDERENANIEFNQSSSPSPRRH